MDKEYMQKLTKMISSIPQSVTKEIEKEIEGYLDKCGLFYKCFFRIKKGDSICKKLELKIAEKGEEYKIQDLIGARIVVYFKEDIALCEKIVSQHFTILDVSKNAEDIENFGPQRINYVCRLPEYMIEQLEDELWKYPIDKSFEIQIRTIFSEGWHEIEHDFRYKCKDEWVNNRDLSRTLNGIFATLDNCDWAIDRLLTQVAYRHYKNGEWVPMLKNVLRIRLADCKDMHEILDYFDNNRQLAKQYFRFDREEFLISLSDLKAKVPLTMKNVILMINIQQIHNDSLYELTSDALINLMAQQRE